VGVSLVLVLVVLPRRYVLSSGFMESGVNFPVSADLPPAPVFVSRPAGERPPAPIREAETAVTPVGPAEALWNSVLPLILAGDLAGSIPLFQAYLARYPGDRDVRTEYASTLLAAGDTDAAVEQLRLLLSEGEDPRLRVALARALRDGGRPEAASAQYALLWDSGAWSELGAEDALLLEWAGALAWAELYTDAEDVLEIGRTRNPGNPVFTVELARIYYYTNRLEEAEGLLASLSRAELAAAGGVSLSGDVMAALAVPEVEEVEPTLVERALRAREEGRDAEALELLESRLARAPDDVEAWIALANLRQYELFDLPGALEALRRVEALDREAGGPEDPALQYRLALLEGWTGDEEGARRRFMALLDRVRLNGSFPLGEAGEGGTRVDQALLLARLGDLYRWSGNRPEAAGLYRQALSLDPGSALASGGMVALERETTAYVASDQDPRYGAISYGIWDTDEYTQLDLGAEWAEAHQEWVWGVRAGSRWLDGFDAAGAAASTNGVFGEGELGRWWRWGTLRTSVRLGVQELGVEAPLVTAGAEARLVTGSGTVLVARAGREPGFLLATTLQSVFLDLVQDALAISVSARISPTLTLWSEVHGSRLSWDGAPEAVLRGSAAVALDRAVGGGLSIGAEARALTFDGAAPLTGAFPGFWDPRLALSLTPQVRWQRALAPGLTLDARGAAGPAWLDERRAAGSEVVPVATLDTRLQLERAGFRSTLGVFYRQSRFSGYRNWGGSLTVSRLLGGAR
jgi:tetratricopeptide (TPR) repeat protein